ncbi:hypothetical protein BTA51_09795 [Hahella sp. CCB-MM4]|uniref:hypothetical protein n=1 Tax=Hahella sp. (strain CCB-MM4) TaxID=1926491 RepID=UPI000B9AE627|nr:hypothetical protein [Hahella sp. CCB-MM4]OZG74054.1 hypothetical protein BTA51_09795 [Hahella sp. CCB-MM4]
MKLLGTVAVSAAILTSTASVAGAEEYYRSGTQQELRELRREVQLLRRDIARLENLVIEMHDANQPPPVDVNLNNRWGCYINDIRAGGVYGVGATEAEAKGVTLEKCSNKGGACFESNLKCSENDS